MIYWIGWGVFRALLVVLGHLKIVGAENVPASGAVLVAANHISIADPPAVGVCLRRPGWFMGKEELFRSPPLRWLCRSLHAFPVRRGKSDLSAVKKSLAILARGEVLVMFPEGTRQPVGQLGQPETGVGMIALRSKAPVVPVHISGTDRLLPKGSARLHRAQVTLRFGPPLRWPESGQKPGHDEYQAAAEAIMKAIGDLA